MNGFLRLRPARLCLVPVVAAMVLAAARGVRCASPPARSIITIQVVDDVGEPIPDAQISKLIYESATRDYHTLRLGRTDARGLATITEEGHPSLVVEAEEFFSVSVGPEGVHYEKGGGIRVVLWPTQPIVCVDVSDPNDQPVLRAQVTVNGSPPRFTDAQGRAVLRHKGAAPEQIEVRVSAKGFVPQTKTAKFKRTETPHGFLQGTLHVPVGLEFAARVRLKIAVHDTQHRPIDNAQIAPSAGAKEYTDAEGSATLEYPDGAPEKLEITVAARDYEPDTQTVVIHPQGTAHEGSWSVQQVAFTLSAMPTKPLTVEVLDADTGRPVVSAQAVALHPHGAKGSNTAATNGEGEAFLHVTMEHIQASEVSVEVSKEGYATALETVPGELFANEQPRYLVHLKPAARAARSQRFDNPMYGGMLLDWCITYLNPCGKPAADTFCKSKGFDRADAFEKRHVGLSAPTKVISDGSVCKADFCDAFAYIVCKAGPQ